MLRRLIVEGDQDGEGLKSEGLEIIETKGNYEPLDNCVSYLAMHIKKRYPALEQFSPELLMAGIHEAIKARRLIIYKEIPKERDPQDFIVIYINARIESLIDYTESDDTVPLDRIPYISHVGIIMERVGEDVYVASKMVHSDVYKHKVNNESVLKVFCGGDHYYFIDTLDLTEVLLPES